MTETRRPPSKPWRVQRVGSIYEDFRSQPRAYAVAADLSSLGIELKVWHWENGDWRLYEHINDNRPEHCNCPCGCPKPGQRDDDGTPGWCDPCRMNIHAEDANAAGEEE